MIKEASFDELLLIEANCKKIYYEAFDIIIANNSFGFIKRTKNPLENEVNALMSYGYALLYANYCAVLDRSRLLPQLAFVHSNMKSTEPLKFDLADILKPVIVDRLIFSIIRHNELKKEYFTYNQGRCYLNKDGVKYFVQKYDEYLGRSILINNRYFSYKSLISREVYMLSNYISKESDDYSPYVMKW